MRKILVAGVVVLVGYLAISGNGRISADTTADANSFACGLAQVTRQAVRTTGDAVHTTAGLIRDNTGGPIRDVAQRLVDTPESRFVSDRLNGWVAATCG